MTGNRLTHGGSDTRLYTIWCGMIARCEKPTHDRYADYGGRGIAVCSDWRGSFEVFRNWAQANGYSDQLTIERRDNDAGYLPGNCRWATRAEQSRNRRTSALVQHQGSQMTIAELSERTRVSYSLLKQRIRRYGWPVDKAISTPSRAPKPRGHPTPVQS
jgi:hypothetical protein